MKAGGFHGSFAVAMVITVVLVLSNMQLSKAQSCLQVSGGAASFADATSVVQQLRVNPGQCCQTSSGFCTVVLVSGTAAATVCGPTNFCPNCADVGNGLNQVLAQCNVLNEVEGVFSPTGDSTELFYLTSSTNHP